VLMFFLTLVYLVPFRLLGVIGPAVVLAALTIFFAALSSRVYHLGHRVRALETGGAGETVLSEEALRPSNTTSAVSDQK
jgi:hypothetical protein